MNPPTPPVTAPGMPAGTPPGPASATADRHEADICEAPDIASSTDAYAQRFRGSAGAWFLDVQARAVLHLLDALDARTVLDVGGGHAQLAGPLVKSGREVVVQGSDPRCGARLHALGPTLPGGRTPGFVVGRLDRLPFPDAAFDVVVSVRMLAHVPDAARFLSECCRVAARGVIVDFPSRRSLNILGDVLFGLKKGIERSTRRYRSYSPGEPASIVREVGFAPAGVEAQYFLPMALHRMHGSSAVGRALEGIARIVGLTRWLGSPRVAAFRRLPPDGGEQGDGEQVGGEPVGRGRDHRPTEG